MTNRAATPSILVTRPKEDAKALISELEPRNLNLLLEPILDIKFVKGPGDP